MFASAKNFNKTVWLVILSTFGSRFTQFMVWPYMALFLNQRFGLNEAEIGLFIAIGVTIGISFGFYVGYLSDKIGRRKLILLGLVGNIVSLSVLAFADSYWVFLISTTLVSMSRSMVEGPARALMTDMLVDRESKDLSLHIRYFALNTGAALGPLLGIVIGITAQQTSFAYVAAVFGVYLVAALIIFKVEQPLQRSAMDNNITLGSTLKILRADTAFMLFVFAAFLASTAYGQLDSTLLQYLKKLSIVDFTWIYALMIFTNGVTIMMFQFPLMALLKNWPALMRAGFGVSLFFGGFFGFAIADPTQTWQILLPMFILSIGESTFFPVISVITDEMAPEHLKGTYVGATGLQSFGFAIAPVVGGSLLFWFGGYWMWLVMAALALVVAVLFATANRINQARVTTT